MAIQSDQPNPTTALGQPRFFRRFETLYALFQPRLSRRIAFWIFLSLVLIETLVFVPSYLRREQELLRQQEEVSKVVLDAIVRFAQEGSDWKTLAQQADAIATQENLLGLAIYDRETQQLLKQVGDKPTLSHTALQGKMMLRQRDRQQSYYEVAWILPEFNNQYVAVIRHDTTEIQEELVAYTARITGIVILISLVLTFATMIVIGNTVIIPILRLRDDLGRTAQALNSDESPDFYASSVKRQDELGQVLQAFGQMYERIAWEMGERKQAEAVLRVEQAQSERLLLNILPAPIAEQLKAGQSTIAQGFPEVTILFADLVEFTELAAELSPRNLVILLNDIVSTFDQLSEKHNLEKIKTIGDAYMVVGGVPISRPDHAHAIANMALEMQTAIKSFNQRHHLHLRLRIGINTGSVVAGVIGKKKFIYDLWGDAVNIASRMESHGSAECIQISEATYHHLKAHYLLRQRGKIAIKGKGTMITYWLVAKLKENQ